MTCYKNITNTCNSITNSLVGDLTGNVYGNIYGDIIGNLGYISGNVMDGTYFLSEIEVSNNDIVSITSHRDANHNIFIGHTATATSGNSIAIGTGAVNGNNSASGIVIGTNSSNDNAGTSIAFGNNVDNHVSECISIGRSIENHGIQSIRIGTDNNGNNTSNYSISIGNSPIQTLSEYSVNLGSSTLEEDSNGFNYALAGGSAVYGDYNVVLGYDNLIGTSLNKLDGCQNIGIDNENMANNTLNIGTGLKNGQVRGINLGTSNDLYGIDSTIIGYNNVCGNLTTKQDNCVLIGANITNTSNANQLVFGGSNQFDNVYINDLATNTQAGVSSIFRNVQYNSDTKELSYSNERSGTLVQSGNLTISGTGSQTVACGFAPVNVRIMLDNGLSSGGAQAMTGEWTYNSGTPVQYCRSIYVSGATNVRGFHASKAIALTTNGSTYSEQATISNGVDGNSFSVNCTVYGSTRNYYYVATG